MYYLHYAKQKNMINLQVNSTNLSTEKKLTDWKVGTFTRYAASKKTIPRPKWERYWNNQQQVKVIFIDFTNQQVKVGSSQLDLAQKLCRHVSFNPLEILLSYDKADGCHYGATPIRGLQTSHVFAG